MTTREGLRTTVVLYARPVLARRTLYVSLSLSTGPLEASSAIMAL